MEEWPLNSALNRVRGVVAAGHFADASDAALLGRCVAAADEAAFAALVHRHGAMVHAVCRRIVRDRHDAEDACQATFLVLARRAACIRKLPSVASWLHGVARRVSLTLVRERSVRRRREGGRPVPEPAAAEPPDPAAADGQAVLDEELDRLPARLKGPIVLCYLEGKTRDEAAAALGLTPGQLHGVLQRGRDRLHRRLVGRGVTLGAAFLATATSGGASLPPTLIGRVCDAAAATLGGPELGPAGGGPPTHLANEVLRAMSHAKLKAAVACGTLTAVLLGGGLLGFGHARPDEKPVPPAAAAAPQPTALEVRKVLAVPAEFGNDFRQPVIAVSSDQKAVLSRNLVRPDVNDPKATSSGLHLLSVGGDKPKRTTLGDSTTIGFVPKSTLAYSVNWGTGVVLWDTRTHEQVGEPIRHTLREDTMPPPAVSPDGTVLVTRRRMQELQFWNLKTRTPITPPIPQPDVVWQMDFSADGKWLFSENSPNELRVWDAKTGAAVAGPFRDDAGGRAGAYAPKTRRLATAENVADKTAAWSGEAVVRSGDGWGAVRRVKVNGLIREVKWLDDDRLLVVCQDRTDRDAADRPIAWGRNALRVVTLTGDKADVQTLLHGVPWVRSYGVSADGRYVLACTTGGDTQCWRVGEAKPVWTKPGRHEVAFAGGDWALLTHKGSASVHALADGKELWRHDKAEAVRADGSDVWVFGPAGVEVWRVGRGAK